MMASVNEEYAEALFTLAEEQNVIDDVDRQWDAFTEAYGQEEHRFFTHPGVTLDEKKNVLKEAVGDTLFRNFLFVMLDNDRLDRLDDIHRAYRTRMMQQSERKKVRVYAPAPLKDNDKKRIMGIMKKKLSADIDVEETVDSTLRGGLRIEYDGKVWDGTIQNLLKTMQDDLTT